MASERDAANKLAVRIQSQHRVNGKPISSREAERKAIKVAQKSDNQRSR